VTALHGVLGCEIVTAQPGGDGPSFDDLTIGKVDIKRDMALLWSDSLNSARAQGLEVRLKPSASDYASLQLLGYPLGLFRQKPTIDVKVTETTELGNLLPERIVPAIGERGSPSLDIKVLSIQSHLLPGHSGAPLLTKSGQVVGIGNGGLDLGRIEVGWAIPWSAIEWKTVSPRLSQNVSWADRQKLSDLEKLDISTLFSVASSESEDFEVLPTATNTPTVAPSRTLPVATSTTYVVPPQSFPVSTPTPVIVPDQKLLPESIPSPILYSEGYSGNSWVIKPAEWGINICVRGEKTILWKWDGVLRENMGFEIGIWKKGDPSAVRMGIHDARNTAGILPDADGLYRLKVDLKDRFYGDYYLNIAVVNLEPYSILKESTTYGARIACQP